MSNFVFISDVIVTVRRNIDQLIFGFVLIKSKFVANVH